MTLVQIALAVKNVPFDQIVFVQYPVLTDPDDANRVVPNDDAATALFDALATNQQIVLTGQTSQGDGTVSATPSPTPTDTAGGGATPTPTPGVVDLPSAVPGQTAAQETCSNGNVGQ